MDYFPGDCYTADNHCLVYEVAVSNTDGYSYTKTFTHDFYNLLTIYTYWKRGTTHRGRGSVDKENMTVVKWSSSYTSEDNRMMILSLDDGPLVPLKPVDGSKVGGWYADRGLTQFVSAENPYRHPMKSFRWSNFIGHYPRKELSRKPEYSFTAWENCNVVPEFQID